MITEKEGKRVSGRRVLAVAVSVVILAAAGFVYSMVKDRSGKLQSGTLQVSVIDVGKGDCILARKGDSSVLIDCGYSSTSEKVITYLRSAGIKKLDALIITHYHKDHVGGAAAVLESFAPAEVYLPDYDTPSKGAAEDFAAFKAALEKSGASLHTVTEDTVIMLGNDAGDAAVMTVYASDIAFEETGGSGNHNDCSLVVSLVNAGDRYLFAADIEEEGIRSYMAKHNETYDVLKVPHHGNRKPGTADLIISVSPKIALVTDSTDDQALESIISTLKKTGADVYRTSLDGTVVIESSGNADYSVSTWK